MREIAKRPVLCSVLFGVKLGAFGLLVGTPLPVATGVGVALSILIYVLYRPGGPGQRWVDDLSDG